jgi:hypothetical protein
MPNAALVIAGVTGVALIAGVLIGAASALLKGIFGAVPLIATVRLIVPIRS